MSKTKRDFLEQIAKYSKEEIVEAIGRNMFVDAERFLSDLIYIKRAKAIEEERKLIGAESAAADAYIRWQNELVTKYGDGKTVSVGKLPASEIAHGDRLAKAWDKAREALQTSEKKVRKLLEL